MDLDQSENREKEQMKLTKILLGEEKVVQQETILQEKEGEGTGTEVV